MIRRHAERLDGGGPTPQAEAMAHPPAPAEYKDLLLFLGAAGVVVPGFKRLKLSPTLGFLIAGVALGPQGLGRFADSAPWLGALSISRPDEMAPLAELGVAFLLFTLGLELSFERLRLMRRLVFGLGAAQVAVCSAALAAAGAWLGASGAGAWVLGAALALSSTAVAMPALAERKRLHSGAGRAVFAVLLFQDIAVAPLLIVVGLIGRDGGFGPSALLALVPAALGLIALVVLGRVALRPLMRLVVRSASEELFVAACLLVVVGAGLLSAVAGLSMALGAFVAGLMLAETEYRHEVERTVEPFKGLLLGLFFLSVGTGLDLDLVLRSPVLVLGLAAVLLALKGVIVFALARAFRLRVRAALEAALALAAGGEFAFVLLGQSTGLIAPALLQPALAAATLSMFAIPALIGLGAQIGARKPGAAVDPALQPPQTAEGPPRVLIVGYGRVGQLVGEMLSRHDIAWTAVERDARLAEAGRRRGLEVFVGDAGRPELLRRCGLDTAPALVLTTDAPDSAELVVSAARAERPELVIVARARDARHAARLYQLGGTDAVPETVEASLQLSEAVLVDIGVPMGLVIASIHEKRDAYRRLLDRPEAPGGRRKRARRAEIGA